MKNSTKYLIYEGVIVVGIFLLLFFAMQSCKTVYRDIHHYDTVQQTNNKIDSIFIKDSIFVYQNGDTVKQYVYKYIYKDKFIHDTVYKHSTDTITKIEKIQSDKQRETFFNRFGKAIFYILFGALLTFAGIVFWKFIKL